MRVNLIGIKIIGTIHNIIIRSILSISYISYVFIFWNNIYYLIFGGILFILNLYILKKNVLTLRGYQNVASLLDELLFMFLSNLKVLKVFINDLIIKFTNKKIQPFIIVNIKHNNRLKG